MSTWFYFRLSGYATGVEYTFHFKNCTKPSKLFKQGMRPLFREVSSIGNSEWAPIHSAPFNIGNMETNNKYSFCFEFASSSVEVEMAYSYPFSYTDNQKFLDRLEAVAAGRDDIYFNRERPVKSLEGLEVDLLTITSREGLNLDTLQKESLFDSAGLQRTEETAPYSFPGKKYIFLSGRVHPGEVAASHMLNGLLDYLVHDDDGGDVRVQLLLKHFVFVVVPFLNPDGVFRGHYRSDTKGRNLNRMYNQSSLQETPTLVLVHEVISQLAGQ